jgi:hypothetical protein
MGLLLAGIGTGAVNASTFHRYAQANAALPAVTINRGWNTLGVPTSFYSSASVLVTDLETQNSASHLKVLFVAMYSGGQFAVYIPGFSKNVALQVGDAVFVASSTGGTWQPQGTAATSATAVTLKAGWNFFSIPFPTSTDASKIFSKLTTAGLGPQVVATYGAGHYQLYTAFGGTNFPVNPATGLFVYVQNAGSWTPS